MKPLVSLVTPMYNAMPYFKEYLACVKEQTWRPLEFIVVDDGSEDSSWECLQKMLPTLQAAEISVHALHRKHESQAAAVNAALPLISGEYFTWCDADDLLALDSIEKKVLYLMQHKKLGMVRTDGMFINSEPHTISHSAKETDCFTQNVFDALFHGVTYCYAGCYMVRTALFFECYPEKQIPLSPEGQNLQLLLPPASRTDCGFIPEVLHYYYRRSSGHSSKSRSYTQKLSRIENFEDLRQAILPYCQCDRQYYQEESKAIESREKGKLFKQAAIYARRELRKNEGRYCHTTGGR